MAKIAKHIEDPITLKARTQVNQGIMQALKAKGFSIYFSYTYLDHYDEHHRLPIVTYCRIEKKSKGRYNNHIIIKGISYWNDKMDAQNMKYGRAVAFERAYETYQKYIKCT